MTAINAITTGSRGRMLTDTAAYDATGILVGLVAKTIVIPHLGMAFASRGATAARRTLGEELEAFPTFDALVAGGAEALLEAHEAGAFWVEDGESEFDLTLMGWSVSRRQVELYCLSSVRHIGLNPFTFHQMAVSLAPLPDDEALRRIGLKVGRTFDTSRPTEKLVEVIELQRNTPGQIGRRPHAPWGCAIGGAAVLTEISEAGIAQRIVRRWPDQIGSRLDPQREDGPPSRKLPHLRVVA